MNNLDERWVRVGEALGKRIAGLALTKAEVIRRSGVSIKTLNGYLAGEPIRRGDKARDLARALNWPDDAIALILDGQDPALLDIEGPAAPADLAGTIARLDAELAELRKEVNELRAQRGASPGPDHASR